MKLLVDTDKIQKYGLKQAVMLAYIEKRIEEEGVSIKGRPFARITMKELSDNLGKRDGLSYSPVYKTLKEFKKRGIVECIKMPSSRAYWYTKGENWDK